MFPCVHQRRFRSRGSRTLLPEINGLAHCSKRIQSVVLQLLLYVGNGENGRSEKVLNAALKTGFIAHNAEITPGWRVCEIEKAHQTPSIGEARCIPRPDRAVECPIEISSRQEICQPSRTLLHAKGSRSSREVARRKFHATNSRPVIGRRQPFLLYLWPALRRSCKRHLSAETARSHTQRWSPAHLSGCDV